MTAASLVGVPLVLQGTIAASPWDLVLQSTPVTKVILLVLAAFSMLSWVLIFWKLAEFRRVRQSGDTFVTGMEAAAGLRDVYQTLTRLEESPYSRVFRRTSTDSPAGRRARCAGSVLGAARHAASGPREGAGGGER